MARPPLLASLLDIQVRSPGGELLDHVCANDLISQPGRYAKLLDAAAKGE